MNERNANLEFDLNERRKAKKSGKLPALKEEPKINFIYTHHINNRLSRELFYVVEKLEVVRSTE